MVRLSHAWLGLTRGACAALLLAACGERGRSAGADAGAGSAAAAPMSADPAKDNSAVGAPETLTFAPESGVDLKRMSKQANGLYVEELAPGSGTAAQPGSTVKVHYTGRLPSGREFDSSRRGPPFEFTLGQGSVIRGWDEGLVGMMPGGKRRLVIPPELAYGSQAPGGIIPANATLVFEVEMLEVR